MDRIDSKNYALILTVENENSINNRRAKETEEFEFRYYEEESINCVSSWRKNAGWLKDIDIFILCPTEDVSEKTKVEYQKYNVNYINETPKEFKEYDYGFANVHFAGLYFESILKHKILIHIDLDMEILREIPVSFFDDIFNNKVKGYVGGYQDEDYSSQRPLKFSNKLLNTDFIVSVNDGSYSFYSDVIKGMEYVSNYFKEFVKNDELRVYDIEEYGADYAYNDDTIKLLIGYEQGEGYHFNIDLPEVYFWHEHKKEKISNVLILNKTKLIHKLLKEQNA